MLMALRVYNTLTRKKEDFQPVQPGKVGMYVCGPTVYKPSHVGHMVGPVIFDTVKRYLTYLGYQVTFVVNITDIDDKIINEAAKHNPGDFALWKSAKPGEPKWDSPWGPGRPGWHIECSAMSMKILGQTLDIHGGGLDLQFPHHENELAQSESYTDQTFARYWMHNGLLKMGHAKMAGSVGNVVNVADLLEKHSPETVRFLLLSTHYRSPIEYSEDRLAEVKRSLDNFHRFFERYQRVTGQSFYQLQAPARRGK